MTVLVVALMQMAVGIADTASTYDFAATSQWRRQDGIWSPNRQTEGQLPANQQNGSVSTAAFADKGTGVLGATATAMSSGTTITVSSNQLLLPSAELCSFAPDPTFEPIFDQHFGGFVCLHRGVKVGVSKASVKKGFLFTNTSPITYTVTVTVNTDYFEPTASGPQGSIFCEQVPLHNAPPPLTPINTFVPSNTARSQCTERLDNAPTEIRGGFGTVGAKSEGSSFVQLNATAFFEDGSHGDNPGLDFRTTPHGSIEDYPVNRRDKWLHPGVTNLIFQVRGTGTLSVYVELQAQASARGNASAAASCTLDVTSISVTPNS